MRTKTRKADLEGKKVLFFEIGIILALALALAAFEWPSKGDFSNLMSINGTLAPPDDIIIPITKPEEIKQPAPPIISIDKIIIIPDDKEIPDLEIDPFKEFTEDQYTELLHNLTTDEPDVVEVVDFMLIEIKPSFMGGDYNKFNQWVFQNLKYPEEAARNNIQGRVYVEFMIDVDGYVKNVKVVKGVDRLLDQEAVRVITSSPPWKPGYQRDKPTKVVFTFPITFKLRD